MKDMTVLDQVDRGLIHALQLDGRVPFTTVAAVLGTSVQTVARRYARLRAEAGLRVVALLDPAATGRQQWMVRLTATTGTAQQIARALARREDTSWVRLASGGTQIIAIVTTTPDQPGTHALLLHDVPRTAGITAVSAHYLLHTYLGGPSAWPGRTSSLTPGQQARIPAAARPDPVPHTPPALTGSDRRIVAALAGDGRASYADLAAAAGTSAATVARRLEDLRAQGVVFFDLEMNDAALGVTAKTLLWMSVAPGRLEQVATELASHEELAFVAATTGPTNLVAVALFPDLAQLHQYLTQRLGSIQAIGSIETSPVLETLKAGAPL
jgi:DNA-binding Lrp family transcriptional regulator